MNKNKILLTLLLLCLPFVAMAQRDTLNVVDWQFSRSNLTPVSATKGEGQWKGVRLPHDFLVEQPWVAPAAGEKADNSDVAANVKSRLSARGFKEMGIGWYRHAFSPNPDWKGHRVMLEVGGIMLVGDVYLNGERIGGTEYGYIGFGIDISDKLRYGQENVLVVKADTRRPENSRWYTGGGLYRDVKFIVTDKSLYFDRHPLYITTTNNDTVHVRATICNYTKAPVGCVVVNILDANGHLLSRTVNTIKYQRRKKSNEYQLADIPLPNAHLWDLDSPYLYTMTVSLTKLKKALPLDSMEIAGLIDANLKLAANLKDVEAQKYDKVVADGKVGLQKFTFKSTSLPQGVEITEALLAFSPKAVNLDPLNVIIGKSDVSLKGNVENYLPYILKGDVVRGSVTLNSNLLDCNELLAMTSSDAAPADTAAAPQTQPTTSSEPLVLPENIDFRFNTDIAKLLFDKLELANINGRVALANGVADLSNLSTDMCDGKLVLNGKFVTPKGKNSKADMNVDFNNVNINHPQAPCGSST